MAPNTRCENAHATSELEMTTTNDIPPWFPNGEWHLASVPKRVSDIAQGLHTSIEEFVEEGLGPARATSTRLSTGEPVTFMEHTYALAMGTLVLVDAGDFLARGLDGMLVDALRAAHCGPSDLLWTQGDDPETKGEAARRVAWAAARRRGD